MNDEKTSDHTHDVNRPEYTSTPVPEIPSQYADNFDYDMADARLKLYEADYQRFEEENATQPKEWWDDAKRTVRAQMEELRSNMNRVRDNAPDAWGEMKDAIGASLSTLGDGYRRSIRELQTDTSQRKAPQS